MRMKAHNDESMTRMKINKQTSDRKAYYNNLKTDLLKQNNENYQEMMSERRWNFDEKTRLKK